MTGMYYAVVLSVVVGSCILCLFVLPTSQPDAMFAVSGRRREEESVCPISHRSQLIKSYCRKYHPEYDAFIGNGGTRLPRQLNSLLVDDEHKMILCPVHKSGYTSWREYLMRATGHGEGNWSRKLSGTRQLIDYNDKAIRYRLKNYFKVMVARHPLDRLMSAYNDKFIKTKFNVYMRPYIIDNIRNEIKYIPLSEYKLLSPNKKKEKHKNPILRQHQNKFRQYLDPQRVGNPLRINFTEFLHCVYNLEDCDNRHWRPIYKICNPCEVGYDVVLKIETMKRDSDYVIQKMSEVASVHGYNRFIPATHKLRQVDDNQFHASDSPGMIYKKASLARGDIEHSGINLVAEKPWMLRRLPEYDEVPQSLLDGIAKMYWLDFVLFGYDFNPQDQMMQCSYTLNKTSCC